MQKVAVRATVYAQPIGSPAFLEKTFAPIASWVVTQASASYFFVDVLAPFSEPSALSRAALLGSNATLSSPPASGPAGLLWGLVAATSVGLLACAVALYRR